MAKGNYALQPKLLVSHATPGSFLSYLQFQSKLQWGWQQSWVGIKYGKGPPQDLIGNPPAS